MKQVRRADIMSALLDQLNAVARGIQDEPLMLSETIIPIVDISDPSKIPYVDWIWTGASTTGQTLVAAKPNKRFVITHIEMSAHNGALDTGTLLGIVATINGGTGIKSQLLTPASVAGVYSRVFNPVIVVDVNTAITTQISGAYASAFIGLAGYYVGGK